MLNLFQTFVLNQLKKIKEKVESKDDKKLQTEMSQIEKALIEGNHISANSLDELLLTPVVLRNDVNQDFRDRDRRVRGYVNPNVQQNYRRQPYQRSNQEF